MEQANHTFLYMLLSISGMQYSALVDTGSSINIMSRQVYDALPSSHKSEIYHLLQSEVSVANNTTVKVDGTARVKVNIEGHVHSLLFYIFPTCTHPIILGTHYLISHNIHIDFEKMTLQGSRAKHIKIRSTRRIDLPPQSETIVWGKAPTHILSGTQGICSNDSDLLKKGVMVAKSLCTVPVDRFVPLKLLNSTHYSVCIPKGKCLSSCELLTDMEVTFVPISSKPSVSNVQQSVAFLDKFEFSDTKLTESQIADMHALLSRNSDLFVTPDNPSLGFTDMVQHKISLKSDAAPKHQRPYRLPPEKKEVLRHHLDELLAQGIIAPVSENEELPITSPIVLVSKRCKEKSASGKVTKETSLSQFRFCCDFRYLNSQTQEFRYTIPNLQDLTEWFTEFTPNYFTSIDLSSGFFQMGISPDSTRYTAFNTCFGTYKFLRLPMGLSTAPNSFQLLMDKVLKGLTFRSCLCYLDDVLIVSESFENHMSDIQEVLDRFRAAGLKLNPAKCHFAQDSCVFLGHMISSEGIRPPPDRVKAIIDLPIPRDANELRRTMGLFNWFRKYIDNFSAIAFPLQQLLKKGASFLWTDVHTAAFEHLRMSLTTGPVLAFPDFRKQFRIAVDTSSKGIGYMLYQQDGDTVKVIRFGSKSLSKWQQSYGPTKLELLGMVTAVLDCADYVRGSRFIVECDHQALRPLFQKQLKGAIYERWLAILQQFSIDIQYKPAEEMQVADALSRNIPDGSVSDFSSPSEDDPYFPYVTEARGEVRLPEGNTLQELIATKSNTACVNRIKCVPVRGIAVDDGYDADTDDLACQYPGLGRKLPHMRRPRKHCEKTLTHTLRVSEADTRSIVRPNDVQDSEPVAFTADDISVTSPAELLVREIDASVDAKTNDDTLSVNAPSGVSDLCVSEIDASTDVRTDTNDTQKTTEVDVDNHGFYTVATDIDVSQTPIARHSSSEVDTATSGTLDDITDVPNTGDFSIPNICRLQRQDVNYKPIISYITGNMLPESQKDARKVLVQAADYFMSDNVLYYSRKPKSVRAQNMSAAQLALPISMVKPVLQLYHESAMGAHCGIQATLDLVREHYFFPRMSVIISDYVRSCHECQTRKVANTRTKMGIKSYPLPTGPFQVWQMDLYGPLPVTSSGCSYVFTAVDMFTKVLFAEPLRNKDSISVAHALFKLFCTYGTCRTLLSDQGREFMSECMTRVCELLQINQEFTPSYVHHCLGAVERSHRTLAERLTSYVSKGMSWEDVLPGIIFSINCTPHAALRYSPFEILFGTRPTFPLARSAQAEDVDGIPGNLQHYMTSLTTRLGAIRTEIKDHAVHAASKMLENVNTDLHILALEKGDYVYLQTDPTGRGRKLKPTFTGPYIVHREYSDHLVILRDPHTNKCLPRPIHKNRLKPAHVRVPNPVPYLMDRVVTKHDERRSSDSDISSGHVRDVSDSETNNPEVTQNDIQEPEVRKDPTSEEEVHNDIAPRRSTRTRQQPIKFRDGTYLQPDCCHDSSDSDFTRKVKRILAERNVQGRTEYLVHFVGEPAQNAKWLLKSDLTNHALKLLRNRPPPVV